MPYMPNNLINKNVNICGISDIQELFNKKEIHILRTFFLCFRFYDRITLLPLYSQSNIQLIHFSI